MSSHTTFADWVRFLNRIGLRYSGRCSYDGALVLVPRKYRLPERFHSCR